MKKTIKTKKLSLNKDTLRKLNENEMTQVNGGATYVGCKFSHQPNCSSNPPNHFC